jgi:hypothetical protein
MNAIFGFAWVASFGESLDVTDRPSFLESLNVVVRRSRNDDVLDRLSLMLTRGCSSEVR